MGLALKQAELAARMNEVPVGAVIVYRGELVAEAGNRPISSCDPSAHAEMVAIRKAAKVMGNYRLPESTLYVTLEPCAMCAGAIVHARIARVVFATRDPRSGAAGSMINLLQHSDLNHRCQLEEGVMAERASKLLKEYFRFKRAG